VSDGVKWYLIKIRWSGYNTSYTGGERWFTCCGGLLKVFRRLSGSWYDYDDDL